MRNTAWTSCVILLLSALLPAAAADAASKTAKGSGARIAIEIGRLDADKNSLPKTYEMLAPLQGSSGMEVGTKLALPAGSPRLEDLKEGQSEASTFSYFNTGLKMNLDTGPADGPGIRLKGRVEVSLVRNEVEARAGTAQPIAGTFVQYLDATFQDGKRKRIALVSEPGAPAFYLDMKVDLVD